MYSMHEIEIYCTAVDSQWHGLTTVLGLVNMWGLSTVFCYDKLANHRP